ncbi:MAG: 16S rRNA (adenine(1518)-N(6)/adenine(1519)-N(6))-dimethyltransferase RsmA [Cyclobacteriaceae bacterium]|nr:16S rRNA (adenine(1518)-N(6)/adenine(1519)-N(6))-dimethyltransferase RsmA [Cyclobacteriaceae bacterium]
MVKPKKHLGQHFLHEMSIAEKISDAISDHSGYRQLIEIGPGTGALTQFLIKKPFELHLFEVDGESVVYLNEHYPQLKSRLYQKDFLKANLLDQFSEPFGIIGNFPYNISSQIFFKILESKDRVTEVVCMLQKEVGERLAAGPRSKTYGILSVLLQAYFTINKLFIVKPGSFNPPPKVDSIVIKLVRNEVKSLDCDEALFKKVVKQGFQNRRKTLRNALKPLNLSEETSALEVLNKRAEELTVNDFINLTNQIELGWKK